MENFDERDFPKTIKKALGSRKTVDKIKEKEPTKETEVERAPIKKKEEIAPQVDDHKNFYNQS